MDTLELVARVFDPLDRQSLIDIGCGPGQLCATLARRGAAMTGIDPSEEMIELARRRAGRYLAVWRRGLHRRDLPQFAASHSGDGDGIGGSGAGGRAGTSGSRYRTGDPGHLLRRHVAD
jgi:SAM-dependent methyltransferase